MPSVQKAAALVRRFLGRIGSLFGGGPEDRAMDEEMRIHLEMQAAEYRESGLPPAEALERARREFGHMDGIRERCRDERGFPWASNLLRDVRQAARVPRNAPGFALAVVLTLGLGIGLNTAIFSLADEILLRQLPVRDPGSLVLLHWSSKKDFPVPVAGSWELDPDISRWTCTSFSLPTFKRLAADRDCLSGVAAFAPADALTVVTGGRAEAVRLGELVSGSFFPLLGLSPSEGRLIGDADAIAGAEPVAVVSDGYWRRRFGADPSVIGRSILINRVNVTVVGVAPRGFSGTLQVGDSPEIYIPISLAGVLGLANPDQSGARIWWVHLMGRMRTGVTLPAAALKLGAILKEGARDSLAENGMPVPADAADLPDLTVGPGGQGLPELRHRYFKEWEILSALGIAVLAIACANVANLLLARGASRRREIGVRLAMGASRRRVIGQLATESLFLALLGGLLAIPLAVWAQRALLAMQPRMDDHRLVLEMHLDLRVFGIAALLALLTGLAFGLVPAIRSSSVNVSAEFGGSSKNNLGGSRSRLGKFLLGAQVALTIVLLIGAGLFARTLGNLHRVDLGFNPANLILFDIDPDPSGSDFAAAERTDIQIAERLGALPGVSAVSFSKMPVVGGEGWNTQVKAVGPGAPASQPGSAMVNAIGPGFLETYGIPIVAGRSLDARDMSAGARAVVINQAMAKAFFGNGDPVGGELEQTDYKGKVTAFDVVGVARDASYSNLRDRIPPTLYLPFSSTGAFHSGSATFAVRFNGDPGAALSGIRNAVRSVNPLLPLAEVRTQEAQIADLSANESMFAKLTAVFGGLALGLASIGLYGLTSYNVARRTNEIGLRIALGAQTREVMAMVLKEYLSIVLVGAACGVAGAFAATRIVTSLLFELSPADPTTYAGCAVLMLVVGTAAAWIPARRAAGLDPMAALRID